MVPMNPQDVARYAVILGIVIVLVIGAGIVLYLVRGRLFGDRRDGVDAGGMLESLRAMRDRGEISAEEFRAARGRLLADATGDSGGTGRVADNPNRTRPQVRDGGELRAAPGFDLTGEPLPRPGAEGAGGGDD